MLVGINTLGIKPDRGGGEELYLRQLLQNLEGYERSVHCIVFTDAENHDSFGDYECVRADETDGLDAAAASAKVDLLYSSLLRSPVTGSVPRVLYAMGLWSVVSGDRSERRANLARIKELRSACAGVKVFVTPSEFMKQQLLDVLEIPLNRTVVAPLGVSDVFSTPQPSIVEKPYILFVGNTIKRKNLPFLLEAFERVSRDIPHTLVVVGRPGEAEQEDWGPRVIRIDRVPSPQLAGLYQHCDIFVCASLYEGSGVTVVEALKSGALVATGRVGGVTEVAGDVPIFFNAESVDSLAGALRRGVSEEEGSRERRKQSGIRLVAEYTWERCAAQTLSAFRRALR